MPGEGSGLTTTNHFGVMIMTQHSDHRRDPSVSFLFDATGPGKERRLYAREDLVCVKNSAFDTVGAWGSRDTPHTVRNSSPPRYSRGGFQREESG